MLIKEQSAVLDTVKLIKSFDNKLKKYQDDKTTDLVKLSLEQNNIKNLAINIIKIFQDEAIEEFEQEEDPENKLYILNECLEKIDRLQKQLISTLPGVNSAVVENLELSELKLPACDFAHFQHENGQNIGNILDKISSKAFKLAAETDEAIIKTKDIAEKIFKLIFKISEELKIGKEEQYIYINNIQEKIKQIETIEKQDNQKFITKQPKIQLISTSLIDDIVKNSKKKLANKIIVYNSDNTVSYLMMKINGVVKKFYLRTEEQYTIFNKFIKQQLNNFTLESPIKSPINSPKAKTKKLEPFCCLDTELNIANTFSLLVGKDLKHPESQCKIAHNELSGARAFYRIRQQNLINKMITEAKKEELDLKGLRLDINTKEFDKDSQEDDDSYNERVNSYINAYIIPSVKKFLTNKKSMISEKFIEIMQNLATNYAGYKSVFGLARNYKLIKEFERTTLNSWKTLGVTGYKDNIENLLSAIRVSKKEFGYHKGCIVYFAATENIKKNCSRNYEKTPTIVYDIRTKKILYLVVCDKEGNIKKIRLNEQEKLFNKLIKHTLINNLTTNNKLFLNYDDPIVKIIMLHQQNPESIVYGLTNYEYKSLQNDVKSMVNGSIRKLAFDNQQHEYKDKFLIIKDENGELHIVNHYGGNRLYKPHDVIPADKTMPTALFLLGIGHFGDVKAAFSSSGEQQALKIVRVNSVDNVAERKDHKDVWDEKEDDLNRELEGLQQNKKLLASGRTLSYLRKITRIKKGLLQVKEAQIKFHNPSRISNASKISGEIQKKYRLRSSDESSVTSASSLSRKKSVSGKKEEIIISHMKGKATHILMQLSGSTDLRTEVNENSKKFLKKPDKLKKRCEYVLDRAIECCDLLKEFHKTGTHNDFKLANIAITRGGKLEIIDFGTYQKGGVCFKGKELDPIVHGTPAFMSYKSIATINEALKKSPIKIENLIKSKIDFPKPCTPSNLKKYYIQRRLYDIFYDNNNSITSVASVKDLISKILEAENVETEEHFMARKRIKHKKSIQKTHNVEDFITEQQLKCEHKSKIDYSFKVIGSNEIIKKRIVWTVEEEIEFIIKQLANEIKNKIKNSKITMGCDVSYDMYSLVSTISGTCNQEACLTNAIIRYGKLSKEDLIFLMENKSKNTTCPIQNYAEEGQGLQLNKLFEDIINYNDSSNLKLNLTDIKEFDQLKQRWEVLCNSVLLQNPASNGVTIDDLKKILNEIKTVLKLNLSANNQPELNETTELSYDNQELNNLLPEIRSITNYEDLFKKSILEKTLKSHNKILWIELKKSLKEQSKKEEDKIKFIFDFCKCNFPNNFGKILLTSFTADQKQQQEEAIINFYRFLSNIVFSTNSAGDRETINKNKKLVAIIFLVSMPSDCDLTMIPEQIKKYLPDNYEGVVKQIQTIEDNIEKFDNIKALLVSQVDLKENVQHNSSKTFLPGFQRLSKEVCDGDKTLLQEAGKAFQLAKNNWNSLSIQYKQNISNKTLLQEAGKAFQLANNNWNSLSVKHRASKEKCKLYT